MLTYCTKLSPLRTNTRGINRNFNVNVRAKPAIDRTLTSPSTSSHRPASHSMDVTALGCVNVRRASPVERSICLSVVNALATISREGAIDNESSVTDRPVLSYMSPLLGAPAGKMRNVMAEGSAGNFLLIEYEQLC